VSCPNDVENEQKAKKAAFHKISHLPSKKKRVNRHQTLGGVTQIDTSVLHLTPAQFPNTAILEWFGKSECSSTNQTAFKWDNRIDWRFDVT
jgi:hypothetical protein